VPPVEPTQRFEAAAAPVASTQRLEQTKSPDTAPPGPPPADRGTGRSRKPLAYAALLVAALGVAYLLTQPGDQGGTTAIGGTTSATAPATSARQASPTAQATSANTAATGASTAAERPGNSGRGNKDLEKFMDSYYSEVTRNTDRTWDQLTPRMQDAAGGRAGYDSFWKTIDKVEVNQIQADPSGQSAAVNLTFTRNDGTSSTETHQLTFVRDRGDYFIDSDQLLG